MRLSNAADSKRHGGKSTFHNRVFCDASSVILTIATVKVLSVGLSQKLCFITYFKPNLMSIENCVNIK